MPRARRSVYVFFHCLDGAVPDFEAFFRGEARTLAASQVFAIAPLLGDERPIERDELELALSIPSHEWVEIPEADRDRALDLARSGVLVTDRSRPRLRSPQARLAHPDRCRDTRTHRCCRAATHLIMMYNLIVIGLGR